jgi:sortase A
VASTAPRVDAPDRAAPKGATRRSGRVLRFLGKACLTAAFIVGAYIVWLLWGTGIYTARQQDALRQEITQAIEDPRPQLAEPIPGRAYAILEIPSIELDDVVVQGTTVEALKKGPGHYQTTADPWDRRGRVGVAGHRTTYGAPFWDLDRVRPGDPIRLITELGTFDYEVTGSREVLPTQGEVLRSTGRPTLVLTTCTPRFSAAKRLIVFAEQVDDSS